MDEADNLRILILTWRFILITQCNVTNSMSYQDHLDKDNNDNFDDDTNEICFNYSAPRLSGHRFCKHFLAT